MSRIIVGIHALADKPPKREPTSYWCQSIAECLQYNCKIAEPKITDKRKYNGVGHECLRAPTIFSNSWVNYSDRRDKRALDMHLRDEFGSN